MAKWREVTNRADDVHVTATITPVQLGRYTVHAKIQDPDIGTFHLDIFPPPYLYGVGHLHPSTTNIRTADKAIYY